MDPLEQSPHSMNHEPQKLLQKADCVWSRMTLEKDEVLFVKLSLAAATHAGAISELIDTAFGSKRHQVLVYVEGTLELTKVTNG
jgi:hypothetical protein